MTVSEIKPQDTGSVEAEPTVTRSVACDLFVGRALINEVNGDHTAIQKSFGVVITVVPGKDSASILIKGVNEAVARATSPVQKFIENQSVHIIEAENEDQMNWLFGSGQKASMAEVRHFSKFAQLKRELGITISGGSNLCPETQKQIGIVYKRGNEERAKEVGELILCEILPKICWVTEVIEIDRENMRCWKEATTRLLSERCGNAVLVFRRSEDKNMASKMEIWGTDSGRAMAKSLIHQFHTPREIDVPKECVKPLIEDRCRMITDIQDQTSVFINFAKFEQKIYLYGLPDCKDQAETLYQDFVNAIFAGIAHMTIKAFSLKWEEFGRMIGPKGRTISRIQEESGVEDIRIEEEESQVVFTGTENAVDIAIQMAEDELSTRKEVIVLQYATNNIIGRGSEIEKKAGTLGSILMGKSDNSWQTEQKTTEVNINQMDMGNEDLFPSLNAVAQPKKNKFGNRKKMTR